MITILRMSSIAALVALTVIGTQHLIALSIAHLGIGGALFWCVLFVGFWVWLQQPTKIKR
jgi:hypothetical protein